MFSQLKHGHLSFVVLFLVRLKLIIWLVLSCASLGYSYYCLYFVQNVSMKSGRKVSDFGIWCPSFFLLPLHNDFLYPLCLDVDIEDCCCLFSKGFSSRIKVWSAFTNLQYNDLAGRRCGGDNYHAVAFIVLDINLTFSSSSLSLGWVIPVIGSILVVRNPVLHYRLRILFFRHPSSTLLMSSRFRFLLSWLRIHSRRCSIFLSK